MTTESGILSSSSSRAQQQQPPSRSSSSRVREKPPVAQTGTDLRMSHLPNPNITSASSHTSDERFEMNRTPLDNAATLAYVKDHMYSDEEVTRKCVYTYEDKYSFSRIIFGDSLVFDSHFESGNLHSAFRVFGANEDPRCGHTMRHFYDLFMHNDLHTPGHTQWYYFSVANMKVGQEVTFYIKNFAKPDSLYNSGMLPLLYSTKKKVWVRAGTDVCYFSNSITDNSTVSGEQKLQANKSSSSSSSSSSKKTNQATVPTMYSLSFTYVFEDSEDLCYFAYCHPYTYSDLRRYLRVAELDLRRSRHFRCSVLCKTVGGNACDLLTITAPCDSAEQLAQRTVVILTARVHPGESNASWMMQGILDFLLGDSDFADTLRNAFVFKVVPMLNPDGVINGNYRTNLSGVDLNRNWSNPDPLKHPTIFHAKTLFARLARTRTIGLLLDIHGHSKEQGLFFYSCIPDKKVSRSTLTKIQPSGGSSGDLQEQAVLVNAAAALTSATAAPVSMALHSLADVVSWKVRLFPRILEAICPVFCYKSCSFKMHKSKASTMRIVAFAEIGIDNAYTLEASLAGKYPWHFGVHDLMKFGADICVGIFAAAPAMSASQYSGKAVMDVQLGVARYMQRPKVHGKSSLRPWTAFEEPATISDFCDIFAEIAEWRPYYDPSAKGSGVSLLSEFGQNELLGGGFGEPLSSGGGGNVDEGSGGVAAAAAAQAEVPGSSSSPHSKRDGPKRRSKRATKGITYNITENAAANFVLDQAGNVPSSSSGSSSNKHLAGAPLWAQLAQFEGAAASVSDSSSKMITPREIATAPSSTAKTAVYAGSGLFERSSTDESAAATAAASGGAPREPFRSHEFRKLIKRIGIINADSCGLPKSPVDATGSKIGRDFPLLEKKPFVAAAAVRKSRAAEPDVFFNRQIVKLQPTDNALADGLSLQPIANNPILRPPPSVLKRPKSFSGRRKQAANKLP